MIDGRSDVLVIGAGPAGCAAGIELARAGRSVCVVDRAVFPRPKTCGDALSNHAVERVISLGAGIYLSRTPHAVVRGAMVVFPDGHRIQRSYGSHPGWIVRRYDLDHALRRALEDSGARVIEGVKVQHMVRTGGRATGAEGRDFRWHADIVIAADGPGSVAWTHADKPSGRRLGIAATAYYQHLPPLGDPDVSEHYFTLDLPGGYGWIFPAVEGIANVGVYLRMDDYRRQRTPLRGLFDGFIARHRERFASAQRVGDVHTWQLPLAGPRRQVGGDGVLVCGDAARSVDPLTGEGIWQALYSGSLAGQIVARYLAVGSRGEEPATTHHAVSAWRLDAPAALRACAQDAMTVLLRSGIYRAGIVRSGLQWAYGSGSMEVTKRVATGL